MGKEWENWWEAVSEAVSVCCSEKEWVDSTAFRMAQTWEGKSAKALGQKWGNDLVRLSASSLVGTTEMATGAVKAVGSASALGGKSVTERATAKAWAARWAEGKAAAWASASGVRWAERWALASAAGTAKAWGSGSGSELGKASEIKSAAELDEPLEAATAAATVENSVSQLASHSA